MSDDLQADSRRGNSWLAPWCFAACLLLLFLAPGHAAEDEALKSETVNIPERGEVTGYVVRVVGREFRFIPPNKWSVKYDPVKKTATLLPPDLEAGLSFTMTTALDAPGEDLKPDRLRDLILTRYPEASITAEFKCYAAGKTGLAFEFEQVIEKETKAAFRLAFVPFDGGVIEFELKTTGSKLPAYHHAFGNLLNSFRIDRVSDSE
ncbi:MAG TPA: hypothetical protein VJW76_10590 [Verrucomicrobiae bacterium]|nr:hypothetical protein [Verrucomicrobiae bacterium]